MFRDLKAFVLLFVSLFLFFSLNWIYNAICLVFVVLIWFENSAPKDPTDGAEMKWPSVAVPAGSQSYLTARDAGATIFNFQAGKLENNSNSKILDINKQAKMKRLKKKIWKCGDYDRTVGENHVEPKYSMFEVSRKGILNEIWTQPTRRFGKFENSVYKQRCKHWKKLL